MAALRPMVGKVTTRSSGGALQSQAERQASSHLVQSINQLKIVYSGRAGGAFRINEFGQVIVPTGVGGAASAYCAGVATGTLTFEYPDGGTFELTGNGLSPGDNWTRPVVALRYTIHADDTLSFEHSPDTNTRERLRLGTKQSLASTARLVRGQTVFALLVNDQRAALVKCPPEWQAKYCCCISLDAWFQEEVCD